MVSLLDSRDVLAVLPTGFGESPNFQESGVRFKLEPNQKSTRKMEKISHEILVICPLVGLIKDQKQEAQSMEISCISLQDLQLKEKVTEQMIFASAEEVAEERFRVALNENESLKGPVPSS